MEENKKFSKWTQEEIQYIKSNYKNCLVQDMARNIGRSYAGTKSKIRDLGLIKDKKDYIKREKILLETNCGTCQKTIKREPWDIKRSKKQFCSKECSSLEKSKRNKGKNHPFWKGGRFKTSDGYIVILQPNHPRADGDGYVKEHRLIMEKFLGRYLQPKEIVHHEDGDRTNNKIENLKLFKSHSEHLKYHIKQSKIFSNKGVFKSNRVK